MTKVNNLLRDNRGASLITFAIIGGLMCLIWVEVSRITGISVSDMIDITRYNLGLNAS